MLFKFDNDITISKCGNNTIYNKNGYSVYADIIISNGINKGYYVHCSKSTQNLHTELCDTELQSLIFINHWLRQSAFMRL